MKTKLTNGIQNQHAKQYTTAAGASGVTCSTATDEHTALPPVLLPEMIPIPPPMLLKLHIPQHDPNQTKTLDKASEWLLEVATTKVTFL